MAWQVGEGFTPDSLSTQASRAVVSASPGIFGEGSPGIFAYLPKLFAVF